MKFHLRPLRVAVRRGAEWLRSPAPQRNPAEAPQSIPGEWEERGLRPYPLKTHVGYLESSEFSCRFEEINSNSALASYTIMREQEVFIDGWVLFVESGTPFSTYR